MQEKGILTVSNLLQVEHKMLPAPLGPIEISLKIFTVGVRGCEFLEALRSEALRVAKTYLNHEGQSSANERIRMRRHRSSNQTRYTLVRHD